MTGAVLAEAVYAAGGNARVAADRLGLPRQSIYARAKAAAVDITAIRRAAQTGVPLSAVFVPVVAGGDVRVTVALADYALLQTQAAMGQEADRLAGELAAANRIIATLTSRLEERAA